MNPRPILPAKSVEFRRLLIDALWDDRAFGYVDEDRFVGTCPVCRCAVGVTFHGYAARADVNCHGGCSEANVVKAIIRARARSAA